MSTAQSINFIKWLEQKARLCEKLGSHREAIVYWSRLLSALTKSSKTADVSLLASIHYHLGMNHQALNEPMKSIYHLKYSVRLNASEPRYYEAFGRAYLRGGHWQVARTQFERAVRLDPSNVSFLRQYSWVLLMMGRKLESRLYARRAYELSPQDSKSAWCLIRSYMESQMYAHAMPLLRGLRRDSHYGRRAEWAIEECHRRLDSTLDGMVLKILRIAMKFDARPFHLKHFSTAESIWLSFALLEGTSGYKISAPAWAAALASISLQIVEGAESQNLDREALLDRFSVSSMELWPAIYRIEEFLRIGSSLQKAV